MTESDALQQASHRAQERVTQLFASRPLNQHDLNGMKAVIVDATRGLVKAAEGKAWAQKALNRAAYLAERIEKANDVRHSPRRSAENQLALEILADELGIKDEALSIVAARRSQSGR